MPEQVVITELWHVFGSSELPLSSDNLHHWTDCEVPANEVLNGVKQVEVRAYGDTDPPNAFVSVTATSHARAVEVWRRCVANLNLGLWFADRYDEPYEEPYEEPYGGGTR